MEYTIHGPFEIKRKHGIVNRSTSAKEVFWAKVKEDDDRLPSACGCYLFAIRASRGIKPWYVGLAGKQPFIKECFADHKINIYNEALAAKKGTPLLFLIAKRTKKDKFAKPGINKSRTSEYLETILIGAALDKNAKLINIKKTKYLRKMCVPCLINTPKGKPSQAEADFKKAIE